MKIVKQLAAAAGALLLAAAAYAQPAAPLGPKEFTVLNPSQPTEGGGKIEVIEFFWYGCGHCYTLEPYVEKWAGNLAKDVVFRRMPAIPNEQWGQTALVFFTLEAMGLLEKHHKAVFDAIHKSNVNMNNAKFRDPWLQAQGIDVAKFNEVAKSFSVTSKMNRARQLTAAYKVDGVPMLVVNGKYVTSATLAGGDPARVMAIVDRLVDMSRKEVKSAEAPARKLELVKK